MNFSIQLKNDIKELQSLNKHLDKLKRKWQLSDKIVAHLNLILDEIVTNIIVHGTDESKDPNLINIKLSKQASVLTIEVIDQGAPFDPTGCAEPDTTEPLQDRKCGGLGILLVKKLSDRCSYTRVDNKNIFSIIKSIPKERR